MAGSFSLASIPSFAAPPGRAAAGAKSARIPPARGGGKVFVIYPGSESLPQWVFRRIFDKNLDWLVEHAAEEEHLSTADLVGLGLPALPEALLALHRPESIAAAGAGRRRLAYDELFFLQLLQARVRHQETIAQPGIAFHRTNALIRPLHESLPFALTGAQARVLREITADVISPRRMSRLIQGDVGSGKTVVALFAMLMAVESGYQAALMAPTEILAEQHVRTLTALLGQLPVPLHLLTGRLRSAPRREALAALASESPSIVVGTHALIQDAVTFGKLGLAVVDEQHRFGVRQRMALGEVEPRPDVLVMSATPIPRSMAMALYGDLDLSVIDELPPGRREVQTLLRDPRSRPEVHRLVREEVAKGRQAFFVYPLVEESDKVELRSATDEFKRLSEEVFPEARVGLVHGRLASEEKEGVMRAFLGHDIDILVATSVVEVGIDVPNATVMVIEHAERFGLSQLHQMRGRVGRGGEGSHCILVSAPGEGSAERLKVLRDTSDGFAIARADLRIRGQGDLFGAQQHGQPLLRFADILEDEDLLLEARARARALVESDARLRAPEHAKTRALLEGRYGDRMRLFRVG